MPGYMALQHVPSRPPRRRMCVRVRASEREREREGERGREREREEGREGGREGGGGGREGEKTCVCARVRAPQVQRLVIAGNIYKEYSQ